ncbi:MAG: metalloregulator ArsR/SmtB family transcription factor [Pseudomonadota bacterium]
MNVAVLAEGFSALGAQPRLAVLRALVRAGRSGLTVGEVQARTGMPASTLSHHLKTLSDAGLIDQEKIGRSIINRANFDLLETLASFIRDECCAEEVQRS